jgi:unsaturated rhamnogalacturonyl hydrolase
MKTLIVYIFTIYISIGILACTGINMDNSRENSDNSSEAVAYMIIEDLLGKPGFMMYEIGSGEVKAVHYAEVCTGFGAVRFAGLLQDSATVRKLSERYMRVLDDDIENTANHVDVNVYGILPLELYMHNKNEKFLKQGLELADIQWKNPLSDGLTNQTRYWIDDVWMINSLQTQAFRVTGNTIYLERAAMQTDAYLKRLQQPNGLFHHGENAPFFWGRGNGWVAAGLAELLSELPQNNTYYKSILEGYKKMMYALLKYQSGDGMWRQLIDNKDAWKETSSTAMFGYAITVGVKKGILPESEFKQAYEKAWQSITGYINDEGQVTEVCVGTGKGTSTEYYLARPRSTGDFHGQAPLLWFAYSLLAEF